MGELLLIVGAISSGVAGLVCGLRWVELHRRAVTRDVFGVSFPRGIAPAAVETFVRSLAGLLPPRWQRTFGLPSVVFEVLATHATVTFRLHVEAGMSDFVVEQLRRAVPAVRVERIDPAPFAATLAGELRLEGRQKELRIDHPADVSSALLAALRPLEKGEEMLLQWIISPAAPASEHEAALRIFSGKQDHKPAPDKSTRAKADGPHFVVTGRLAVRAAGPARSRQLLRRLLGVFHILNAPGASFRHRAVPSEIVARRVMNATAPVLLFPAFLNARELTAVLGVPMGDVSVAGLELGRARILAASPKLPETGPALAVSNASDKRRLLTYGLSSLPYHAWIIGGTGSGKSTMLANIIQSYMKLGAAIVVLDSKRDLVRDVINLIPEDRIDDLVLVDPADQERVVGLNLLAGSPGDAERRADQLVGLLTRLWPGYVGPRSQDILRACFLTLAKSPGNTFVELPLLLTNEAFRRKLVAKVDDPIILEPQWAAYDALSPGERAQHISPLMNKVRAVLARRSLRDIVGQAEGLDIEQILSRGSLLMVPLSKGLIGEDAASLLGSIVLLRVWATLTARIGLSSTNRRPVLIVLDEFQDYLSVPISFADMLAQARGLGVGVIAAHQHVGQLPTGLRSDLRANARSKISFQLAAPDARLFAQEYAPHLTAADLQGLGKYEVAAQICVEGEVLPPATGTTFPPPTPTGAGERARQRSRDRYGRDRAEVDAEIRARHGDTPGSGSVGRRSRS